MPIWLYVGIKMAEALFWLTCSAVFARKALITRPIPIYLPGLSLAFLVFGLADAVEYFTAGRLPWWLWVWKIGGGLTLFAFLMAEDYSKRGAVALSPARFIAAGLILMAAIGCMIWAQRVGGF